MSGQSVFRRLLERAFVFSDNLRLQPVLRTTTGQVADPSPVNLSDGAQLALHLFRRKNGDRAARADYAAIQATFTELTGRAFDVSLDSAGMVPQPGVAPPPGDELLLRVQTVTDAGDVLLTFSGAGIGESLFLSTVIQDEHRVVLLDEPAQNLHPPLQMAILRNIQQRTENQFLVITHSPAMVFADTLESISRFWLEDGATRILALRKEALGAKLFEKLQRQLLTSGEMRAMLFSTRALIVEGESELAAIPVWYRQRYQRPIEQTDTVVFNAHGVGDIPNIARLIGPLKLRWAVICDGHAIGAGKRQGTDIAEQLRAVGLADMPDLDHADFAERRTRLAEHGIFTFATSVKGAFETIPEVRKELAHAPAALTSKPQRAIWVAERIPCPGTVAEVLDQVQARMDGKGTAEAQ